MRKAKPFVSGADMWRDSVKTYGVIGARCSCLRYLETQANHPNLEEKVFCQQLREAMSAERNYTNADVYPYTEKRAVSEGNTELYNQSKQVNHLCAGDIAEALYRCEYGDGTHDFNTALNALTDHYGMERVRFVLVSLVNADAVLGRYPFELRRWAQDNSYSNNDSKSDFRLRTHPVIIAGLINRMRELPVELTDNLVPAVAKKPSLLGKLDDNKRKVERDKAANKDKPATKKRGETEVTS